MLTNGAHGLRSGQVQVLNGSFPSMTFADSSTGILAAQPIWPTGAASYATVIFGTCAAPTTLAAETTYTLTPSTQYLQCNEPPQGFPTEALGKITSQIAGCNLHVCMPLLCSDSYAYTFFAKLLANTVPGRKIYVELSDEPWNTWNYQSAFTFMREQLLCRWNGWGGLHWATARTLQLRTIGRTVFATAGRENEILGTINVQFGGGGGTGATQLAWAQAIGTPMDAYAVAPYWDTECVTGGAADITAWNNCSSIPQMADLLIHEMLFNPTNASLNPATSHITNIANYNTATGNNCVLMGYEGGYQTGSPGLSGGTAGLGTDVLPGFSGYGFGNVIPRWNHDISYDPVWRIYEKDAYAAIQRFGFVDWSIYAWSYYANYANFWGVYHWCYQLPGKGDGSDGKFDNRTCLTTPGQTGSKADGVNQDQQCVSVRGLAHIEWMAETGDTIQSSAALMLMLAGGF